MGYTSYKNVARRDAVTISEWITSNMVSRQTRFVDAGTSLLCCGQRRFLVYGVRPSAERRQLIFVFVPSTLLAISCIPIFFVSSTMRPPAMRPFMIGSINPGIDANHRRAP